MDCGGSGPAVRTVGSRAIAPAVGIGPLLVLQGEQGDGFGAGCNRGLDYLQQTGYSGWVWLLNPDTSLPQGDEAQQLLEALADLPAQAVVGTAVQDSTGTIEPSAGWIDQGLNFRRRKVSTADSLRQEPLRLDWLSGCSLLLQPAAHQPPARFDPCFPLYYEDMDLCLRLAQHGGPCPLVAAGGGQPSERGGQRHPVESPN